MKYSEFEYEGVDPDTNKKFFSQIAFRYVLRCSDLVRANYSTFTVSPDLSDTSVNMMNFLTSYYDVYLSTDNADPSFSTAQEIITNEVGIAILSINNDELTGGGKCPENPTSELVSVFVKVVAGAELLTVTPTVFRFSCKDDQQTIYPLAFSDTNYQSMSKFGER